jgi:acyl-CoA synthetase (AMP-forming)/AMP-acid ligase II
VCVIEESHRGADRSPSSCARKDELRPGYYSRVRIVRHGGDADEMVKPGEAGELIVDASAETFFSGYLNRPDATAENSATAGISPATFA